MAIEKTLAPVAVLLLAFSLNCRQSINAPPVTVNYSGCLKGLEVGDAVYRDLGEAFAVLNIHEAHAGIYYRYIGGNPADLNNHRVIEHPGAGFHVRIVARPVFDGNREYYGAYNPGNGGSIPFAGRKLVVKTGLLLVNRSPGIVYCTEVAGSEGDCRAVGPL